MTGLAKRIAPAIVIGGAALAVVVGADQFFAQRSTPAVQALLPQQSEVPAATAASSGASPVEPSFLAASPAPSSRVELESKFEPEPTTKPDPTTAPEPTVKPTPAEQTCDTAKAVSGPAVDTKWGPVQINATIANGEVCEVHAVVWPDSESKSAAINATAIPKLDARASADGVEFDNVSGATFTSDGYRTSLQRLLDSL
jgi:uncharacterized protein with FMN-binding domain